MRLSVLGRGQSLLQKAIFAVIRVMTGAVPGPLAVLSYRSGFFGRPYGDVLEHAMRRQQHWSVGEVELFAAWVSHNLECEY